MITAFGKRRDKVMDYVKKQMMEQGISEVRAVMNVTGIYFWPQEDVENIYRCIHSDAPEKTKKAIIAHDFTGLSRKDEDFVPKSRQFAVK